MFSAYAVIIIYTKFNLLHLTIYYDLVIKTLKITKFFKSLIFQKKKLYSDLQFNSQLNLRQKKENKFFNYSILFQKLTLLFKN
jgi:hypothetical protein